MTEKTKKSRPLHWSLWPKAQTAACGKSLNPTRSTVGYWSWDNPLIADGRRCLRCSKYVSRIRPRAHGGE